MILGSPGDEAYVLKHFRNAGVDVLGVRSCLLFHHFRLAREGVQEVWLLGVVLEHLGQRGLKGVEVVVDGRQIEHGSGRLGGGLQPRPVRSHDARSQPLRPRTCCPITHLPLA